MKYFTSYLFLDCHYSFIMNHSSSSNRIIAAKDHAAIQLNIADVCVIDFCFKSFFHTTAFKGIVI